MTTPTIEVSQVSKRYRIGSSVPTLRTLLSDWKHDKSQNYHWAVRDLNFQLGKGEALGIIGPNGAGKTTILKLLSKVTYPTSGEIQVNGRFSSLIELGAGFHPDLTGRDNIYLNGVILGMGRAEIDSRFQKIVEFAGIGAYLDTPVKRYSSGMYARLGFSVAAHVNPEILLVDEVLAVGDMAFQRKCYDYMIKLIEKGTTLIFVSHNLNAIQKVCSRCLVMYRGNKVFDGPTSEATAEYSNILRQAARDYVEPNETIEKGISQRIMTHAAVIEDVKIFNRNGNPSVSFDTGEQVLVKAKIRFDQNAPSPVFACTIFNPDGQIIYNYTTSWAELETPDFEANTVATIEFPLRLNLAAGIYYLGVNLAYSDLTRYYDRIDRVLDFVIKGGNGARGFANLNASFQVAQVEPIDAHSMESLS
jgi:ABC-type polysaccharide/polyol phosphate transport system ATPase subunit